MEVPDAIRVPIKSPRLRNVLASEGMPPLPDPAEIPLINTATNGEVKRAIGYKRSIEFLYESQAATDADVAESFSCSLLTSISKNRNAVGAMVSNAVNIQQNNLLQQLSVSVNNMNTTLAAVNASLIAMNANIGNLGARLEAVSKNSITRNQNGQCVSVTSPLIPLVREAAPTAAQQFEIGAVPGALFPGTYGAVDGLAGNQLNQLEAFYGTTFAGNTVAARRTSFRIFIGCNRITQVTPVAY